MEAWSDPYIKTFITHYSLIFFAQVDWNDTVLAISIHHLHITCFPHTGVHEKAKTVLPQSSLDLSLVNFLLWRALQQKLYRQQVWDDCLRHALLHSWIWCNKIDASLTAKKSADDV